ncbi:MAG: cyclic nucleotide-binding domain-containing protein [Desulfosudaceae bacterium]
MNENNHDINPEEPGLELENEDLDMPDDDFDPADIEVMDDDPADASASIGFPTRSFAAGEVIFKEGDAGDEAYLILNGQVKITRKYKKKRLLVNQLGKDQIFGEMAIITGDPRAATAEAEEPTELFIITEQRLNENLSQNLAIVKNLIDQLIQRLKHVMKQQSAALSKIEQFLARDKKVKVLQARAEEYAGSASSEDMDEALADLLQKIREL